MFDEEHIGEEAGEAARKAAVGHQTHEAVMEGGGADQGVLGFEVEGIEVIEEEGDLAFDILEGGVLVIVGAVAAVVLSEAETFGDAAQSDDEEVVGVLEKAAGVAVALVVFVEGFEELGDRVVEIFDFLECGKEGIFGGRALAESGGDLVVLEDDAFEGVVMVDPRDEEEVAEVVAEGRMAA